MRVEPFFYSLHHYLLRLKVNMLQYLTYYHLSYANCADFFKFISLLPHIYLFYRETTKKDSLFSTNGENIAVIILFTLWRNL